MKQTVPVAVASQTLGIRVPMRAGRISGCAVLRATRGDRPHGVAILPVAGVWSLALEDGMRLPNPRE